MEPVVLECFVRSYAEKGPWENQGGSNGSSTALCGLVTMMKALDSSRKPKSFADVILSDEGPDLTRWAYYGAPLPNRWWG